MQITKAEYVPLDYILWQRDNCQSLNDETCYTHTHEKYRCEGWNLFSSSLFGFVILFALFLCIKSFTEGILSLSKVIIYAVGLLHWNGSSNDNGFQNWMSFFLFPSSLGNTSFVRSETMWFEVFAVYSRRFIKNRHHSVFTMDLMSKYNQMLSIEMRILF